jgi:hypothetical protein
LYFSDFELCTFHTFELFTFQTFELCNFQTFKPCTFQTFELCTFQTFENLEEGRVEMIRDLIWKSTNIDSQACVDHDQVNNKVMIF